MKEPLPERPATVTANAYFVEGRNNYSYWAMRQIDHTGEYAEWDLQGQLLLKRMYHDDSGIPEDIFIADVVPEKISNDYYKDLAVISCSRHIAIIAIIKKSFLIREGNCYIL